MFGHREREKPMKEYAMSTIWMNALDFSESKPSEPSKPSRWKKHKKQEEKKIYSLQDVYNKIDEKAEEGWEVKTFQILPTYINGGLDSYTGNFSIGTDNASWQAVVLFERDAQ